MISSREKEDKSYSFCVLTEDIIIEETSLIFDYFDRLMKLHFGDDFFKILALLDTIPGISEPYCGVETSYSTYPALLMGIGVIPKKTYVGEYLTVPASNGIDALTVKERRAIYSVLKKAGFKIVIPPWFRRNLSPKPSYWRGKI